MPWRLSEFDRIDRYFRPLAEGYDGSLSLTNDGAILPSGEGERVITTDTMVEGTHFLNGTDPHLLAQKLLRVNLSDLGAMGAKPEAYLLNLTLPSYVDEAWLQAFSDGLYRDQSTFGLHLAGGDTTSTDSQQLVMTITMFGQVPAGQAIRRDGAKVGDAVLVSGTVGDGLLGLMAAMGGLGMLQPAERDALIKRYNLPNPRVRLGQQLWQHGVRAAADVSDGLLADLGHICAASGVFAKVDLARLPFSVPARAAIDGGYIEAKALAAGGDDYELVFTAPEGAAEALIAEVGQDPTLGKISIIGRIVEVEGQGGKASLVGEDGAPISMDATGWQHGQE
ncbi:MAG: thiamine-phosphate kinase [Alphaproteobacteria bacterium]|nr:thiamine-phosphate kinase [Alphaproteobacteria bacterium SS10]